MTAQSQPPGPRPLQAEQIVRAPFAEADAVAARVAARTESHLAAAGGRLFGVFRPVIGRPQSEIVIVTEWPDAAAADANRHLALGAEYGLETITRDVWTPTLRPEPGQRPDQKGGYYSHRAFDIRSSDWPRFRDLSAEAWDSWEATHSAITVGFWLCRTPPGPGLTRVRLMAWYASLEAWERSRYWNPAAKPGSERAYDLFRERSAMMVDTQVAILRRIEP